MSLINDHCPLCGGRAKKVQRLYDHDVCRRCATKFANRRQFAWLIDFFFLYILNFVVGLMIGTLSAAANGGVASPQATWVALAMGFVVGALYGFKDGFGGKSIGKMVTGVRCVEEETGRPISFARAFKRNLIVIVPLMPLVIAATMMKGWRFGDRFAGTRVIWDRYENHWVFNKNVTEQPPEGFRDAAVGAPDTSQIEDDDNPFRAPNA